jgi:cytochrome d ubiquinol oxidase subunit I
VEFAKRCFTIALVLGVVTSTLQLMTGHFSAMIVAKYQPAKLAAMEGLYRTEASAPLHLFGFPDDKSETVKFGVAVPGMLSFLAHNDFKATVIGLDQFKPEDRPPVWVTFQTYHIMVALGMFFIGITWFALFLRWRGKLFQSAWMMRAFVVSVVFPFVANQFGWVSAEVGRQPWTVYGLLRTSDSVSKSVKASEILFSLIMFSCVYLLLFILFIYVLDRKIKHGPDDASAAEPPDSTPGLLEAASRRGKTQYGLVETTESDA